MKIRFSLVTGIMAFGLGLASGATEIIAHRGASYDAPENTIAAFKLGVEQKADAIELDMYLTRDGKVVCAHDKTTSRTTSGKTNFTVSETDYAELAKLDVGSWKASKYAGEKMPLLEDVLKQHPKGTGLFLEMKSYKELVPELERILRASDHMKSITIICFDLPACEEAKRRMPEVPVYWLIGQTKNKKTGAIEPIDPKWIEQTKKAGLDGLNLDSKIITPEFAADIQKAGLKLYAWTVDDPEEAKRLVSLKVLGITTNRPKFLRDVLGGK